VVRIQRHVDITIFDGASVIASLAYDSPTDFGDGTFGMWSTAVDAQFDDFSFTRLDQVHAPAAPRFASTAQTALNTGSGYLQVESFAYGGESRLEWAGDTAYIAQADIDLNP